MDPEQLLQFAQAAIQQGADPAAVNARLAEVSGGQFATVDALRQSLAPPEKPGIMDRLRQAVDPRAHADAAKSLVQGITLGGGDEMRAALRAIPALMPGGETPQAAFGRALEGEQADMQRIREESPVASRVAEGVGGLVPAALPVGQGARAVRSGAGLLNATARGSGVGAVEGGLLSALSAEGSVGERVRAAGPGAGMGLVLGGVGGAAPAVVNAARRRGTGRGERVGEALQETTGIRADLNASRDASKAEVQRVRREFYRPLEEANPSITPGQPIEGERVVASAIQTPDGRTFAGGIHVDAIESARGAGAIGDGAGGRLSGEYSEGFITSSGRYVDRAEARAIQQRRAASDPSISPAGRGGFDSNDLDAGTRWTAPRGEVELRSDPATRLVELLRSPSVKSQTRVIAPEVVGDGARAPSFNEAQKVLLRLRRLNKTDRRYVEQIEQLEGALSDAVPGFRQANTEYAQAIAPRQALEQGRRFWNKSTADVEMELRNLSGDARREFQRGRLAEIVRRLNQRDNASGAMLKRFVDAGPENQAMIRSLFDDSARYDEFIEVLNREQSADKVNTAVRRFLPYIAAGAVGGGVAQAIR